MAMLLLMTAWSEEIDFILGSVWAPLMRYQRCACVVALRSLSSKVKTFPHHLAVRWLFVKEIGCSTSKVLSFSKPRWGNSAARDAIHYLDMTCK